MVEMKRGVNGVTLAPEGNITGERTQELRTRLLDVVNEAGLKLTIDLAKVDLIDSTGIGVLISAYNSLKKTQGDMAIANASKDIHKMFSIMRLDKHFKISPKA